MPYDEAYTPHPIKLVFILILDALVATWATLVAMPPFIVDVVKNLFAPSLPNSIRELLNVKTYSRLSGRETDKIEIASQKEQHANSTDRSWLRVHYVGDKQDTLVFAKCQANNFFVRMIMSVFGIYRNELNAYQTIDFPVTTCKKHVAQWSPSRFVLALEDLSSQGCVFPNIWSTHVDVKLAQQVLTSLARIHAKFWNAPPRGVWTDATRPYFGIGMGMYTLFNVERTCKKGLVPPEVHKVVMQAYAHWPQIRAYYSRTQPHTMCHGDPHMGNWFIKPDGSIGAFDFQVLCEEHPMRDVAYFMSSSVDPDILEANEEALIRFYLSKLRELGVKDAPSFDDCFFMYRMQLFYAFYAFVFSGGFANLMDHVQTDCGVERIVRVMQRVDSASALYEVLDGKRG